MFKVYSNGVHFQTYFSNYFKCLLQYSTSSAKERFNSSTVDFLVKSLGFSRQESIKTLGKVSSSKLIKSNQNPNLAVDFLRKKGLSSTQIKKVISLLPRLLIWNVDKTLVPKFNALEKLGISGIDLAHIVTANASILRRDMTKITPMISFLKSFVGNNEKFISVLRRSYWLMSADVITKLQPNIELCGKYGLTDERILSLVQYHTGIFAHNPKRLEEMLIDVDKELKIPFESSAFPMAVVLLASTTEENRQSKYKVFKSFGWTDLDIMTLLRTTPNCLRLSEVAIRERLDFFMNKLGSNPKYLAKNCIVLTFSLKDRVLPRFTLLQGLKERKVITAELTIRAVVGCSESRFLEKFVLPYEEALPELCKAYTCRVKGR